MSGLSEILQNCEETIFSTSPYKVSFFNRIGTYRPTWNELLQIIRDQANKASNGNCHLNEMYLPDTPIKLCIDVDTESSFVGDIKLLETKIIDHVKHILKKVIIIDDIDTEIIYNTKSNHFRIYTNTVIICKYRKYINELLQSTAESFITNAVKFDGTPMMRSLYSYKMREQTDEEKNVWVFDDDKKRKVSDIAKGCYIKDHGNRFSHMIKYSGFVNENTEVNEIHEDYKDDWDIDISNKKPKYNPNSKISDEQLKGIPISIENIQKICDDENADIIVNGQNSNGLFECSNKSKIRICLINGEENESDRAYLTYFGGCLRYHCHDEGCKNKSIVLWENESSSEDNKVSKSEWIKLQIADKIESLYKLTNSKKFPITEHDDRYVTSLNSESKIIGISAQCGMGKTTQSNKFIQDNKDKTILLVSPRITFSNASYERLQRETGIKFDIYSKIKGPIRSNKIICQMESLHRLDANYDIIIIDEIESCLTQLVCKQTGGNNFTENNESFERQIKGAKKVIFMDAFLSDRSINYFRTLGLRGEVRKYTHYPDKRTAIQFPFTKVQNKKTEDDGTGKFTANLISELKKGKKFYFAIASKNKQMAILDKIRDEVPEARILCYNKENKLKAEVNVNDEWIKYDIVCTTSTLTVGVNFDVKDYFDFTAVYLSTMSNVVARDTFQSVYRVRYTKENVMYWIHNTWRLSKAETVFKNIITQFKLRETIHRESIASVMTELNEDDIPTMSNTVKDLYVWTEFEKGINLMAKEDVWKSCLEKSNYTLKDLNSSKDFDDIIIDSIEAEFYEFDDLEELTPTEKKDILKRKNEGLSTDIDLMRVVKYDYQNLMMKEDDDFVKDNWKNFVDNRSVFYNISIEKGYNPDNLTSLAIMDLKDYAEFSGMKLSKLETINYLTKKLGLKNSRDFDSVVKREVIEAIAESIISQREKLETIFKIRSSRGKGKTTSLSSSLNLINDVVHKWGGCKIVAVNKKREKFQLKDNENLGKIYTRIKPSEEVNKHIRLLKKK